MNNRLPSSERVIRELTVAERELLEKARAETVAQEDAILAQGLAYKTVTGAARAKWAAIIGRLRARREQLGLSLADIETSTGLKRSALSRLEKDVNANPTLLTIERYAAAVGLNMIVDFSVDPALSHGSSPGLTRDWA